MTKYIYFRTDATLANDDDTANGSNLYAADAFKGGVATSDTALTLYFKKIVRDHGAGDEAVDALVLNVNTNTHKKVLEAICRAIAYGRDPMIVLADDVTNDTSATGGYGSGAKYLHSDITSCGAITKAS